MRQSPARFIIKVWSTQVRARSKPYFFISTKTKNGRWKDHAFQWPVNARQIRRFLERYSDDRYHNYFCPLPFSKPQRKKQYVLGSRLLWADLDEAHPRKCKPVPQIAWQSSPGRYAALWVMGKYFSKEEAEELNRSMTYGSGADKAGWDLTQVLRIPGRRNLKYRNATARLMWYNEGSQYRPDRIPRVERQIDNVDPSELYQEYRLKIKPSTRKIITAKRATVGKRSDVIWRLNNELQEQKIPGDVIFQLLKASVWNKFAGRNQEDEQLLREIEKASGKKRRPSLAGIESGNHEDDDNNNDSTRNLNGVDVLRMSDVEPEEIDYLWYPYIPKKKLTIFEGDPDLGKSWLTLAIASKISAKKHLPEHEGQVIGGNVLMMSVEDNAGDTIKPRLNTFSQANHRRIFVINRPLTLDEDGREYLEEQVKEYKPVLIVIDPLVAYMGSVIDLHKANETREFMKYLADFAQRNNVAIVAVRHLTKGGGKSKYRGIGSIDLFGAARSVVAIGTDPNDKTFGRIMHHIKCNVAPKGPSLGYRLARTASRPFRWTGIKKSSYNESMDVDTDDETGHWKTEADEFLDECLNEWKSYKQIKDKCETANLEWENIKARLKSSPRIKRIKRNGRYKYRTKSTFSAEA